MKTFQCFFYTVHREEVTDRATEQELKVKIQDGRGVPWKPSFIKTIMVKVENYTFSSLVHILASKIGPVNHLSIGFPFAKRLRNFCGKKRKIFLSLSISFVRKKQQFAQSFAKVISCKIALFRFCKTQILGNSAIS